MTLIVIKISTKLISLLDIKQTSDKQLAILQIHQFKFPGFNSNNKTIPASPSSETKLSFHNFNIKPADNSKNNKSLANICCYDFLFFDGRAETPVGSAFSSKFCFFVLTSFWLPNSFKLSLCLHLV